MSGRAAALEPGRDYGHGTTDWQIERWDADQAAWATARMRRKLPERIMRVHPEPVQRDFHALKVRPYNVTDFHGNVITNAGWQALLASATTGGTPMFTATKGRLGIGTVTTTAVAADTKLGGDNSATTALYKFMAAAPTVGSGTNKTWTFVATFLGSDFNFAWNEFGIDQGTADSDAVAAVFLNHVAGGAAVQGTKTSGQVWTATAVLSFT